MLFDGGWRISRIEIARLGEDFRNDPAGDVSQSEVAAAVTIRQFGVVDPEQVQDRGVQIVHVDRVLGDLESEVVREVSLLQEHVIALGGGALIREENRKHIKDAGFKVVYLRCEPQVLFEHIQADPDTAQTRPALTHLGGGVDEIRKLLADREPIYRQAMTAELDVTHLTPEEAVVYIVRLL